MHLLKRLKTRHDVEEEDDFEDMMIGMMMKTKAMLQSKSLFSMKQHKKHWHSVQHKRRRPLRSDEPNGSDTSDCLVPDGVPLTVWTTSNDATSSIEVPLFA